MKLLSFLFLLLGIPSLFAQQSGIDQSMDLVTLPTGEKVICWFGHTGRSYFVQVSHPNNPLSKWTWAPVMESGNDEAISHEVDGTADKGFFRLKYTDQVPAPGETLESADFDNDGISNIDEIDPPSPLLATDPLNGDTDGDGLNDGWERSFAAEMLALGAPPEHWGANFPSLQSGDLDPLAILQDDGMTLEELYNASSANDYRMLLHDVFIQAKRAEFGFYVNHDSISYDDGRPTVNDGGGNIVEGSSGYGSGTIETWSRTPPSSLQLDVQLDPFAVTPNTSLAWFNNESQYAGWTYHTHWDQANDPNPWTLFPIEEIAQSSVSFMLTHGGSNMYYQFQATSPVVFGESTTKIRWSGDTKKSKFRLYRPKPTKDPLEQYFLKVTTEHPIVMIDNDPGNVGWSTSPPTKTVEMITATVPAYDHTSPWIETTPEADAQKSRTVDLLPVEVAPDDDQPGKTGDQIPSNNGAAGEKHFVSPKKSKEIPDDFVVIKAKGIEKALFEQLLEWECVPAANGSVDPNASTKYRVKRDATGKTVVKIKIKDGGQEVDLINVWVVWADTEVVQSLQNLVFGAGLYSGAGITDPTKAWQFKFKIKPVELFSKNLAADLPKLDGSANSDPPGNGIRYFVTAHLNFPDEFGDTASLKWDVSRQVEVKVFNNPSGDQVPLAKFVSYYSYLKAGQPAAETKPILYPADAAQGNDDPSKKEGIPLKDEDSDPYKAIAENNGLDHEIGEITSFDSPVFGPFVSEPESGSDMVQIANFREFARLEIKGGSTNQQNPTNWYRVSDYIDWHHVWAAIYGEKPPDSGNFTWVDSGSSSGNNVFTPPNE